MFIMALFIIVKIWNQPKCPSTVKWIKNMQYIHYENIQKVMLPFGYEQTLRVLQNKSDGERHVLYDFTCIQNITNKINGQTKPNNNNNKTLVNTVNRSKKDQYYQGTVKNSNSSLEIIYFSLLVRLSNSFIHFPNIWHKIIIQGISYDHQQIYPGKNGQQKGCKTF